jgi:hypothetical protein
MFVSGGTFVAGKTFVSGKTFRQQQVVGHAEPDDPGQQPGSSQLIPSFRR